MQTVLVELVSMPVGCGDKGHAAVEQRREQARQDHRIGDVADLHFIETHDPPPRRQRIGSGDDRIGCPGLSRRMHLVLRQNHEIMEMQAEWRDAGYGGGQRIMEHVHQHRLAAPDAAMDIEATRLRRPAQRQPAPARASGKLVNQAVKGEGDGALPVIRRQLAGGDARCHGRDNGTRRPCSAAGVVFVVIFLSGVRHGPVRRGDRQA